MWLANRTFPRPALDSLVEVKELAILTKHVLKKISSELNELILATSFTKPTLYCGVFALVIASDLNFLDVCCICNSKEESQAQTDPKVTIWFSRLAFNLKSLSKK